MSERDGIGDWDPRIVAATEWGSTALDLRDTALTEASVALVGLVVDARDRAADLLRDAEQRAAAIVAAAEADGVAIRQRAQDEADAVFEIARARIDAEVRAAEARRGGTGEAGNGTGAANP